MSTLPVLHNMVKHRCSLVSVYEGTYVNIWSRVAASVAPPAPGPRAEPGLSSEQNSQGMVLVCIIILVTVDVLWELSRTRHFVAVNHATHTATPHK